MPPRKKQKTKKGAAGAGAAEADAHCASLTEFQSCMRKILKLKDEIQSVETDPEFMERKAEISTRNKQIKVLREAVLPWWTQFAKEKHADEDSVAISVGGHKITFSKSHVAPKLAKVVKDAEGPRDALEDLVLTEQQRLAVCQTLFDLEACGAEVCGADGECAPYEQWRSKWGMKLPAKAAAKPAQKEAVDDDSASTLTGAYDRFTYTQDDAAESASDNETDV